MEVYSGIWDSYFDALNSKAALDIFSIASCKFYSSISFNFNKWLSQSSHNYFRYYTVYVNELG